MRRNAVISAAALAIVAYLLAEDAQAASPGERAGIAIEWVNADGKSAFRFDAGDPSSAKTSEKQLDLPRVVSAGDGSFALQCGPGKGRSGSLMPAADVQLQDGQEAVFVLRRLEMAGEKGWKSLSVSAMNADGETYSLTLGATGTGFVAARLPEWKNLGHEFSFKQPAAFAVRRANGELSFFEGGRKLFSIGEPKEKPFNRIRLGANVQQAGDALLAEFGPSELRIAPLEAPPTPPPLPPAKAFPRVVIGSVMLWSTPYSRRFNLGGFPKCDDSGFYENAPLIPEEPEEEAGKSKPALSKRYFKDCVSAGIDVIDHCLFDANPPETLLTTAEALRLSGSGVKIMPMMDKMPKDGTTFLRRFWECERLRNHPNLFKVGECPVVITYAHHPAAEWRKRIAEAEQAGGRFFIINDTSRIEIATGTGVPADKLREATELVSGLYYFGSHSFGIKGKGVLSQFLEFGRSFSPPKVVGAGITPGYISSTRVGNMLCPRGTELFRKQWIEAIQCDPDFIYLTTLNDYSESTVQECSGNATFSFIDLNAYFGARWRTGKWPELKKAQAFLSYRKAVSDNELVPVELVLLRPELTGDEAVEEIQKRFQAEVRLKTSDGSILTLPPVRPDVLPGHLCWRFWTKSGLGSMKGSPGEGSTEIPEGFAMPSASVAVDGKALDLPQTEPLPAFAVLGNGEQVARNWLYVPLHRVHRGAVASVTVKGNIGNSYPRAISLTGLPWDQVSGGLVEREASPLHTALSATELRDGFTEELFTGPGWAPMMYQDGWIKRCMVDRLDRYAAVVRMKDDTFVYPLPASLPPPKADPSTVMDLVISPSAVKEGNDEFLADAGPLRRKLALPKTDSPERPAVLRDAPGKPWFLRFDGAKNRLSLGAFSVPPGPATLEVWLRPRSVDKIQTVFDSWGAALSVGLDGNGKLNLLRVDQLRRPVWQRGETPLRKGQWHHVVAVFDGMETQLYLDGKADGPPAECHGLRTDEKSSIGAGTGMLKDLAGRHENDNGSLNADIASFRILQRAMPPEEIERRFATSSISVNR